MVAIEAALGIGAAFFIGWIVEHRLGIIRRLTVVWYTLVNAEVMATVTESYHVDLPFDHVQEELKNVIREEYMDVSVEEEDETTLVMNIGDHFSVTLETDKEDQATFSTTKIVSTMRAVKPDLGNLFDALQEMQTRSRAQADKNAKTFDEDTVTVELLLPHRSKYVDFHLPFGAWLVEHAFTLQHAKYDWTIEQDDRTITIQTSSRDDMRRLLRRVHGPFLTL